MTEISCSNGDLSSIILESSTPSNQSEYFSVTSSLNILNSNEEVYHSLDEEVECDSSNYFYKKTECHKIVKQNNLDIDLECNGLVSANSDETIPEAETCRNSIECEFWDKYLQPLRILKSQESINTFEEDFNNSSLFSNSQLKDSSLVEDYNNNCVSDNDESGSCSINVRSQLNTSQIDGELSDINDIVYESSMSQVAIVSEVIPDENDSTQTEPDNEVRCDYLILSNSESDQLIVSKQAPDNQVEIKIEPEEELLPIYEMVKMLESSFLAEQEDISSNSPFVDPLLDENVENVENCKESLAEKLEETPPKIKRISFQSDTKKPMIENVEDSPVKSSYLCCSNRKRKSKRNSEQTKIRKTPEWKTKKIFSFFKKSAHEKTPNETVIVEPVDNSVTNYVQFKDLSIDYDGIPFIDADVAIDSEKFISLATQETFTE